MTTPSTRTQSTGASTDASAPLILTAAPSEELSVASSLGDEEEADLQSIASSSSSLPSDILPTTTTTSGGPEETKAKEVKQMQRLSRRETLHIRFWRFMVLFILVCAGAIIASVSYYFLEKVEEQEFLTRYLQFSKTIKGAIHVHLKDVREAVQGLSETITASQDVTGETLPFLTVPMFEVIGAQARKASGIETLAFSPLIAESKRIQWGNYSVANQQWRQTSRQAALQKHQSLFDSFDYTLLDSDPVEHWHGGRRNLNDAEYEDEEEDHDEDDEEEDSSDLHYHVKYMNGTITPYIFNIAEKTGKRVPAGRGHLAGPYAPVWQQSPPPLDPAFINYNILQLHAVQAILTPITLSREGLFTEIFDMAVLTDGGNDGIHPAEHEAWHDQFESDGAEDEDDRRERVRARRLDTDDADQEGESEGDEEDKESQELYLEHPHSLLIQPVMSNLNIIDDPQHAEIVGVVSAIVPWDTFMTTLLPAGVEGIVVVVKNSCGQVHTWALEGPRAFYLGPGDHHEEEHEETHVEMPLFEYEDEATSSLHGHCEYTVHLYAGEEFEEDETDEVPVIFAGVIAGTFLLVIITFLAYDRFVQRRNTMVVNAAARSNVIISSLFPSNVRDRLFAETDNQANASRKAASTAGGSTTSSRYLPTSKSRLRNFLDTGADTAVASGAANDPKGEVLGYIGKPIADLFPDTTVLFADIAGFTAWSSVREPAQVFTLLEALYRAFDEIAHRRRVFKVETVGDCYVAVTGVPDPQKDHAVIMARFARDCMTRTRHLTKRLETTLGPDTGDLVMRMGIHSGQVTGGVLRGERSRFQLFGDTMNTASRMESTGESGRVQISQDTAELLRAAGKSEWIFLRQEMIVAKGKGEMQTYWLATTENRGELSHSGEHVSAHGSITPGSSGGDYDADEIENLVTHDSTDKLSTKAFAVSGSRTTRLVEWNVDVLLRLLRQIVARRNAASSGQELRDSGVSLANDTQFALLTAETGQTAIDEVKEIITLPKFNAKVAMRQEDPEQLRLPAEVVDQLYDYVINIAAIYNENPFHNFEHASHVTMSVVKLLSRIVAPNDIEYDENAIKTGKSLHDHTYGITSDPLTQFACVFSALIHDADHSGVPNAQLVKENAHIAAFYKGKSVAEQNSVDLAWHLLMDDAYAALRNTIYRTDAELKRFRQLVVNSVMATDIVDKELKKLRNERWATAFSEESATDASRDAINRKATIVIEHLIQASDVAHTMQHWHIYRKWNERFFVECYKAYEDGRAETDPTIGWYKGELGFFDFYIIPLAKKLKDCGVFGVSSDEYLNYAQRNRQEWEQRGREVLNEMIDTVKKEKLKHNKRQKVETTSAKSQPAVAATTTAPVLQ